jgi:hypothetical protein
MRGLLAAVNGRRRLLQALLGGLFVPAAAARAALPALDEVARREVLVGDTVVTLVTSERHPGGLRFVSLHENERTAVVAARAVLQQHAGRLIELRSRRTRLVTFRIGGTPHVFDPNRIFTDVGLEKTLRRYSVWSRDAQAAVTVLRDAVLETFADARDRPVVALHNNGAGTYSINQYRRRGSHETDAADVAVNAARQPDEFFLVTTQALFAALRDAGFNVVLQSDRPTDDGSLSVWFQREARPYVNVEARHGRTAEQVRMLQAIVELMPTPAR